MNAFIVDLENRPGALATVTEAIAAKGIDITAFSGSTCGDGGTVVLLTNDEAGTRSALMAGGWPCRESEVVAAAIEHRPGGLAAAARRLADAGVNIEAAFPTGMSGDRVTIALATNDPVKAREALGSMVPAAV